MMDFTGNINKIYQFVQNACIVRINQADNIHYKVFDAFCLSRTLCIVWYVVISPFFLVE